MYSRVEVIVPCWETELEGRYIFCWKHKACSGKALQFFLSLGTPFPRDTWFLKLGNPSVHPAHQKKHAGQKRHWEVGGGFSDPGQGERWHLDTRLGTAAEMKTMGGVAWGSKVTEQGNRTPDLWWQLRSLRISLLHPWIFFPLKISTEEESTKRKKSQKGPMKTKKLKTEKRDSKKSVREKFEILSVEVCNTWYSL